MASRSTLLEVEVERATGFLVLRTLRASLCSMVLRSASTLDAFRTLVTSLGTAEGVAEDESIKLRAPCINAVQVGACCPTGARYCPQQLYNLVHSCSLLPAKLLPRFTTIT